VTAQSRRKRKIATSWSSVIYHSSSET